MGQPRESSILDVVRHVFHSTGIAWLTPLVGKLDSSDLEYLRASVLRDLEWAKQLVGDTDALKPIVADLSALAGQESDSKLLPIRYPWHVPSGWTDYGGVRLALLAALPARAYGGALAELVAMEPLVLAGSRPKWRTIAADIEAKLATAPNDPSIPSALQAMWREIDFGRNYWRVRVAKNTTITTITWTLVLAATLATVIVLPRVGPPDPADTNMWLIALLGLLGGSISALRSTDMISMGERRPIEIEASRVRLRPVVGAASAIVIYVLGRSNLIFELVKDQPASSAPVQIKVPNIALAYYAFAFLAGFAERWFLKILEIAETRTDPQPPIPKPKP